MCVCHFKHWKATSERKNASELLLFFFNGSWPCVTKNRHIKTLAGEKEDQRFDVIYPRLLQKSFGKR